MRRAPESASVGNMVGRIPVMDVTPVVNLARHPAKASVGEVFDVTALVFREGHDQFGAEVVLTDPGGVRRPPQRMREVEGQVSRMAATVTPDTEGAWTFEVQAWSDPIGTWLHDAGIKIRAGVDVDLMFAEGVLLLERVSAGVPKGATSGSSVDAKAVLSDAIKALGDTSRPVEARLAVAESECAGRRYSPPIRCATCSPPRAPTRSSSTASGRSSPAGMSSSLVPRAPESTRTPARSSAGRSAPPPSGCRRLPRWAST